jgi:hypothetical protein
VKLEPLDGMGEWVNPSSVVRIASIPESWESRNIKAAGSRVHMADGNHIMVKGTPDEVHAKLFPAPPHGGDSIGDIYTLALDVSLTFADRLPPNVVELARRIVAALADDTRKALGREGA